MCKIHDDPENRVNKWKAILIKDAANHVATNMASTPFQKELWELAEDFVTRELGISRDHPYAHSPRFLVEKAKLYQKRARKMDDLGEKLSSLKLSGDDTKSIMVRDILLIFATSPVLY